MCPRCPAAHCAPALQLHRTLSPTFPIANAPWHLGLCYVIFVSGAVAETLGKWHMNTDESEKAKVIKK